MAPHDLRRVLSDWMRSFSQSSTARGMRDYWAVQRAIAESLIELGTVLVARPSHDSRVVTGWLCCSDGALHYAYVTASERRRGVCLALLSEAGELRTYTHRRDPQTRFLDRRGLVYDPGFLAEFRGG
jgi:hypothetical protein